MLINVFFSFHIEQDSWRANVVKNNWLSQNRRSAAGFWDTSVWEQTKREGSEATRCMIDEQLENSSVTAVLIGRETADEDSVKYAIQRSYELHHGMFGLVIHGIPDQSGNLEESGRNPLNEVYVRDDDGIPVPASRLFPTCNWVLNDGHNNFATWVEKARSD